MQKKNKKDELHPHFHCASIHYTLDIVRRRKEDIYNEM